MKASTLAQILLATISFATAAPVVNPQNGVLHTREPDGAAPLGKRSAEAEPEAQPDPSLPKFIDYDGDGYPRPGFDDRSAEPELGLPKHINVVDYPPPVPEKRSAEPEAVADAFAMRAPTYVIDYCYSDGSCWHGASLKGREAKPEDAE
jgi:hypothetical protein